jgi:hypothetical protein
MQETGVDFVRTRDTSEYQRDGTLSRVREYVFYIDKHGPFTERVPLEPFDAGEITRRVDALRMHLQSLPR